MNFFRSIFCFFGMFNFLSFLISSLCFIENLDRMISRLSQMARGGKFGLKREARNNIPLSRKGSDESDEDYTVGEDEDFNESEDEDCSLAEDESEDSLGEFVEEEEEEEEPVTIKKKVRKPGGGKCVQGRKKNGFAKGRKEKITYSEEEDYDDDVDDDDDDFFVSKLKRKHTLAWQEEEDDDVEDLLDGFDLKIPRTSFEKKNGGYKEKARKSTKVLNQKVEEEGDYDDSYEDDDEEFTPDEVDGFDEEELPATKKNKVGRLRVQETYIARGKRRKRNTEVLKKTKRKEPVIEKSLRKRIKSDHGESSLKNHVFLKKKKDPKPVQGRRRKPSLDYDSDFVSSGSVDCEYRVSEEEREQVREASEFCGSVATALRSSNALKMVKEEEFLPLQRKCPGRKGKEKVVDMNVAVGMQVCGICLSEEGKRTVRGMLNCCSHYFCFTCIMEWSKVESRCPLCKQRFATVCRTARDDLRDLVIQVPERDQVYQPSEEELRGYLDPYENVLCTECLQGGDDALMLLCDICDSPAHSYCVGLGREVPEGNWYCDGCRPTALTSLNAPHLNPTLDLGASNNLPVISSPVATVRETFDLNELYVPETPLTQVAIPSPSPRHSIGDTQATSPGSGSGAFTLFERRRIQRQIHQLLNGRGHPLNNRSRQLDGNDAVSPVTVISLFGSQITRDGVLAPQHTVNQSRMAPQNIHRQGRLPENSTPLLYRREVMLPRLSSLRGHVLHNQASTSTNHTFDGLAHGEFVGINERISRDMSNQQLYPCSSTSNTGSEASMSPFQFREVPVPSRTLQGSMRTPF
ncbi:uncharacterized protein [Primulina huaijiensis]|uniref:uncharacterized protein isoform X2 n=1 Tax=Primulina huaijiensis TaxID=1492673 RepID=UPI003CC6F76E